MNWINWLFFVHYVIWYGLSWVFISIKYYRSIYNIYSWFILFNMLMNYWDILRRSHCHSLLRFTVLKSGEIFYLGKHEHVTSIIGEYEVKYLIYNFREEINTCISSLPWFHLNNIFPFYEIQNYIQAIIFFQVFFQYTL